MRGVDDTAATAGYGRKMAAGGEQPIQQVRGLNEASRSSAVEREWELSSCHWIFTDGRYPFLE